MRIGRAEDSDSSASGARTVAICGRSGVGDMHWDLTRGEGQVLQRRSGMSQTRVVAVAMMFGVLAIFVAGCKYDPVWTCLVGVNDVPSLAPGETTNLKVEIEVRPPKAGNSLLLRLVSNDQGVTVKPQELSLATDDQGNAVAEFRIAVSRDQRPGQRTLKLYHALNRRPTGELAIAIQVR